MSDPHRPLSEGKIAALKLLKLAYDDAEDAGTEARQFAVKAAELMADRATSSDLLWLLNLHYVKHVREVTREGELRRRFAEATTPAVTQDSCFFLTYGGNTYVEENGLHGQTTSKRASGRDAPGKRKRGDKANRQPGGAKGGGKRRAAAAADSQRASTPDERETPSWVAAEGKLYWGARVILHLATWADVERRILDAFEAWGWESPIPNPIPRDAEGDPTQSRRHAVCNLNRRLGKNPSFKFFCLEGDFVGWRARSSPRKQT